MENQTPLQTFFHILSFVTPEKLPDALFWPRIILGGVGIFFLIFIIFSISVSSWIRYLILTDAREFLTFRAFGASRLTKQWEKIISRLETRNEAEYKLAIIEADAMLDQAMARLGFKGETLEDKLNVMSSVVLPSIKEVREIHRLRNTIVHDPNYILSFDEAKKNIEVYEKAFKELDLI